MSISFLADHRSDATDVTGERIAALMFRHKLTVTTLATAIGKGRASISTKVNGHARWFLDELVDVAEVLDTSVGYLLGETDDDRRPAHLRHKEEAPTAEAMRTYVRSVPPEGFEPPTFGTGNQRSIP